MSRVKNNIFGISIILLFIMIGRGTVVANVDLTSYLENPSFEEPAGLFPDEEICDADGWLNAYGYDGTQCPVTLYKTNPFIASDGFNCLRQVGTTISQVPAALIIQPNTIYTVQADIAVTSDTAEVADPNSAWALIELKATESDATLGSWGGLYPHVIADDISGFTTDTWYTVSCQFDSGDPANSAYVGETLAVFAQGDRHYIDNFSLSSSGTQVNLTVNSTAGAEDGVLVPGQGSFPVADGWTIPLETMRKYASCPDLYTFTSWTGANDITPSTDVTISGNTVVTANYSKTTPGCSNVWNGETVFIYNADFEDNSANGYTVPFWSKGAAPTGSWVQTPPDGSTGANLDFTSSGNKMIYVGSGSQIHQVPGEIIEADTIYTVEIDMASRSDVNPEIAWAYIALFAKNDTTQTLDGTQLVQQGFGWVVSELLNPNPDQWYTKSFSWDSTASPHVGKYLQIYLNADRVTMDNVRILKSTPGIAANVVVDSDPYNLTTAGGRPDVSPSPGTYQIGIGAEVDVTAGNFLSCPDNFVADFIQSSYGDIPGTEGTLLIDDDGTINTVYATDNICGDSCHPIPLGDFDQNCIVDFEDLADFISSWLTDNRP